MPAWVTSSQCHSTLRICDATGIGDAGRHGIGGDRWAKRLSRQAKPWPERPVSDSEQEPKARPARRSLERAGEHLDSPTHDGRGVTANRPPPPSPLAYVLRRQAANLLLLAGCDRFEASAEAAGRASLHLTHHQLRPVGDDEIQLTCTATPVAVQHAVAAFGIPALDQALSVTSQRLTPSAHRAAVPRPQPCCCGTARSASRGPGPPCPRDRAGSTASLGARRLLRHARSSRSSAHAAGMSARRRRRS